MPKEGPMSDDVDSGNGQRKRLLVLASTFPRWRGDTEPPFVFNLSRDLASYFDVTVLAPHAPGSKTSERIDDVEVRRFRYAWPERLQKLAYGGILPNLKRNKWLWLEVPFFVAAELFAAWRLIRAEKPDVIHAHWVIPQGIVAGLLSLSGVPVMVTAHGGDVYGLQGRVQNAIKRWVINRSSRLTAVSKDLKDAMVVLAGPDMPSIDVISMGIDTDRFHPDNRDPALRERLDISDKMLLFVGRLAEKKGVRYLLEAMPAIVHRHPNVKLVVVGDGPLRQDLEARTRSQCITPNVTFLGAIPQSELPKYYASADVFVGPSIVADGGDTESFGLVFAEAMASGCPVVASDLGGIQELIRNGDTGLMVPQRDPAAIAAAVGRLLGDEGLHRRLARDALRRVRAEYDQALIARRYGDVLQEAAAA
jgi:glycosyltransferase involved in cell wall biosynthesis